MWDAEAGTWLSARQRPVHRPSEDPLVLFLAEGGLWTPSLCSASLVLTDTAELLRVNFD